MRDRLMKLLCGVECDGEETFGNCPQRRDGQCGTVQKLEMCQIGAIADRFLENGGIMPLCKVGDEVWFINCLDEIVYIGKIHDVRYNGCGCIYRIVRSVENGGVFAFSDYEIGKSVFRTSKEAEQALKGEHHAEIH